MSWGTNQSPIRPGTYRLLLIRQETTFTACQIALQKPIKHLYGSHTRKAHVRLTNELRKGAQLLTS